MADFIELDEPLSETDEDNWPPQGTVYIEPSPGYPVCSTDFEFRVCISDKRIVAGFNEIADARFYAAILCALRQYPGE